MWATPSLTGLAPPSASGLSVIRAPARPIHDDRSLSRHGPGELQAFEIHHSMGVQYDQHQFAPLAFYRGGEEQGCKAGRDRSSQDANSPRSRLAHIPIRPGTDAALAM